MPQVWVDQLVLPRALARVPGPVVALAPARVLVVSATVPVAWAPAALVAMEVVQATVVVLAVAATTDNSTVNPSRSTMAASLKAAIFSMPDAARPVQRQHPVS
jgi:hypothetical protein